MLYSSEQIAEITNGTHRGPQQTDIHTVLTDSRSSDHSSHGLFVALRGPTRDGHQFIAEAYAQGTRCFLVEEIPSDQAALPEATFIQVINSLRSLQAIASDWRSHFEGAMIAITGSNGKTIVKEWLAEILQQIHPTSRNPRSYNSQLGVALSTLMMRSDDHFAICEAGISQPGEMEKLAAILRPDFGIFTNMGDAHQENFQSLDHKASEKVKLFTGCKKVYYCNDHPVVKSIMSVLPESVQRINWTKNAQGALLSNVRTEPLERGLLITGIFSGSPVRIRIPFKDAASIENLIQIWLFLLDNNLLDLLPADPMMKLESVTMRLEQKEAINRCTLINDFYNSDILSFKVAIDLLFQQTPQTKKSLILSDFLQTGLDDQTLIYKIDQILHSGTFYRIIGIGPILHKYSNLFTQPIATYESTQHFLDSFNFGQFEEEAILLKGARKFEFERISLRLERKIHQTRLEIRMDSIRHNLNYFRRLTPPNTKIMAMVKAFSYGSSGFELARFLDHERVDYLGVAFADEGIELRNAGIRTPIMIMNPDFNKAESFVRYALEPEVFQIEGMDTLLKILHRLQISNFPVHLKIDTGMHRLGFEWNKLDRLIRTITNEKTIRIQSVFSHLSSAADDHQDDFTLIQIKRFKSASNTISEALDYPFTRHILNSAGVERFPEACCDMVRLGIGLHGFSTISEDNLIQATSLKSVITQIHELQPGETVGYGRKGLIYQPSRIAVIPIGYADGIDRRLGNGNYAFLIHSQRAATIGDICMDMCMVDVTGIEAEIGSEVLIFGPELSVLKLATCLQTSPYEVLTSIHPRVTRVFLFE